MKASTERKVVRWLHIVVSVPLAGYLYGPVSKIPEAVFVLRWILFPMIVLSGIWMWQRHRLKNFFMQRK
jgi:hypothetical protein